MRPNSHVTALNASRGFLARLERFYGGVGGNEMMFDPQIERDLNHHYEQWERAASYDADGHEEPTCEHGDDPLLCNECRGEYDEPWDPEPDYDEM